MSVRDSMPKRTAAIGAGVCIREGEVWTMSKPPYSTPVLRLDAAARDEIRRCASLPRGAPEPFDAGANRRFVRACS